MEDENKFSFRHIVVALICAIVGIIGSVRNHQHLQVSMMNVG